MTYYGNKKTNALLHELVRQINKDNYKPDYVVGINPTGIIPAVKVANYFGVPVYGLDVHETNLDNESNFWMSEDAFGYIPTEERRDARWDPDRRKNILIIDDVLTSSIKFEWIKEDWSASCFPSEYDAWNSVWHFNVRFGTLLQDEGVNFPLNYNGGTISADEKVTFEWEAWWKD